MIGNRINADHERLKHYTKEYECDDNLAILFRTFAPTEKANSYNKNSHDKLLDN